MKDDNFDFEQKAHHILIHSKKYRANDVADAMGMKYDTLYRRLSQRNHFKSHEINALLRICPEPALLSCLLDSTSFSFILRTGSPQQNASLLRNLIELNHLVSVALKELRSFQEPLPKEDRQMIETCLRDIISKAQNILNHKF